MAAVVPLKVASGVIQQFIAGDTIAAAYLSGVAPLTGATFTGNVVVDSANASFIADADTGTISGIQFHESGTLKAQLAQDYSGTIVGIDNAFFFQNAANGSVIVFLGKSAGAVDKTEMMLTPTYQALYYDGTPTFLTATGGFQASDGTNTFSMLYSSGTFVLQTSNDGLINIRGSANVCISASPTGVVSIYYAGSERIRAGSAGLIAYGTTHQAVNSTDAASSFTVQKTDTTSGRAISLIASGSHYQDTPGVYYARPHTNGGAVANAGFVGVTSDNNLKIQNLIDGGEVWIQADTSGGTQQAGAKFTALGQTLLYNASARFRTVTGGAEVSADGTTFYPLKGVLVGTVTSDRASINANSFGSTFTITVTGAVQGDPVIVSASSATSGVYFFCEVSSNDTVTVKPYNSTGSAIDMPSLTFKAVAIKT